MKSAIKLTKHAIGRMQEREITTRDVIRVLAFGEAAPTRQPAVYRTRIARDNPSDKHQQTDTVGSVVVVYQQADDSAPITVITVF